MEKHITILTDDRKPISPVSWAVNIFLATLPLIGFILLLVWAFGEGNIHRKNWAKGMLILYVIGIVVAFFFFVVLGMGAYFLSKTGQAPTGL